ncbi:hypothetical protein M8J76_001999 [Diaphorina citri]|nr:hypothetical protein M8J76_001999 [Diaphorina citri]
MLKFMSGVARKTEENHIMLFGFLSYLQAEVVLSTIHDEQNFSSRFEPGEVFKPLFKYIMCYTSLRGHCHY